MSSTGESNRAGELHRENKKLRKEIQQLYKQLKIGDPRSRERKYREAAAVALRGLRLWCPRGPEKHDRTCKEMAEVKEILEKALSG